MKTIKLIMMMLLLITVIYSCKKEEEEIIQVKYPEYPNDIAGFIYQFKYMWYDNLDTSNVEYTIPRLHTDKGEISGLAKPRVENHNGILSIVTNPIVKRNTTQYLNISTIKVPTYIEVYTHDKDMTPIGWSGKFITNGPQNYKIPLVIKEGYSEFRIKIEIFFGPSSEYTDFYINNIQIYY